MLDHGHQGLRGSEAGGKWKQVQKGNRAGPGQDGVSAS